MSTESDKQDPVVEQQNCGHEHVERYVTAGRFAPVKAYWSCASCGESFAPDTELEQLKQKNETQAASARTLREFAAELEALK